MPLVARIVACVVVALHLVGVAPTHPGGAHAATTPAPPRASLTSALLGESYTLSGRTARRGAVVVLQRFDPAASRWRADRVGRSASSGRPTYRFVVVGDGATQVWRVGVRDPAQTIRTTYSRPVVVAPAVESLVLDAPAVVARGSRVALRATVTPVRPGRLVEFRLGSVVLATAPQDGSGVAAAEVTATAYGPFAVTAATLTEGAVSGTASPSAAVYVTPAQRPAIAAHRGGPADGQPENTLAAFRSAADAGADLLESDTQQTADGGWVMVHDTDLRRTTDAASRFPGRSSYAVRDFTLAEIGTLTTNSAGEPVPTLDQFLDLVASTSVPTLLEVKAGDLRSFLRVLQAHPGLVGPASDDLVTVCSFSLGAVRSLDAALSALDVAWITTRAPQPEERAGIDDVVVALEGLTAPVVAELRAEGHEVFAWTVNSEDDLRRAAELDVSGVITDSPRRALRVLRGVAAS